MMGYLGYLPLIMSGLSAAGSLYGGLSGASAAKDAANTQAQSAEDANKLLAEIYAQQRVDLEPYQTLGYASLGDLMRMAGAPLTSQRFNVGTYPPPVAWQWYRGPGGSIRNG